MRYALEGSKGWCVNQQTGASRAGQQTGWASFRRMPRAVPSDDPAGQLQMALAEALPRMLPSLAEIQVVALALLKHRLKEHPDEGIQAALRQDIASIERLQGYRTVLEKRYRNSVEAALAQAGTASATQPALERDPVADTAVDMLLARLQGPLKALQQRMQSLPGSALNGSTSLKTAIATHPLHPRIWVQALRETFSPSECSAQVQTLLVQLFAVTAADPLQDVYRAVHASLAQSTSARSDRKPEQPEDTPVPTRMPRSSLRSDTIVQHLRQQRESSQSQRSGHVRALTAEEFQAILYLLQNSARALVSGPDPDAPYPDRLREAIWYTASRIGIEDGTTVLAPEQADAIDITCRVFDQLLQTHALAAPERQRLEQLSLPYLRMVQADPTLFDLPEHPMHRLLTLLCDIWEGDDADAPRQVRKLADSAARALIEGQQADIGLVESAVTVLEKATVAERTQAREAERVARMSARTRERMQISRRRADATLAQLLRHRRLVPSVLAFLSDQWRQVVIRAGLAGGDGDPLYARWLQLGKELVAIDEASVNGYGRAVASHWLQIEPDLRACCQASGAPEADAERIIAAMVAELSSPDARRIAPPEPAQHETDEPGEPILPVGTEFMLRDKTGQARRLRIAWHSADTGTHLLVDRQGRRHAMVPAAQLAQWYAEGHVRAIPEAGAVEALLAGLANDAQTVARPVESLASSPDQLPPTA